MRKMTLILVIAVGWLSVGGSIAHADGMILPGDLGGDYVVVRSHHVTVEIEGYRAVTRVEQEFHNPHEFPVYGRYLFPVPPDAILSRFQATVDGQRQAVTRQDAAATNATLYATLTRQRDPSLLQYADWESLAFDLELAPGASRVMALEYEQVLAPAGGLLRYRYVLSTERYSSEPLEAVSVTVDLRSADGLSSVYSPSHPVTVERLEAGHARVTWAAEGITPADDFELFFAPAQGGVGGGLLVGERGGQDHFLFLFAPEGERRQSRALPKDIVFVVDRSGSMADGKLEQAQSALRYILGQLGEGDRFSVVAFDDQILALSEALQPAGAQAVADARRFVEELYPGAATDLEGALQRGLEILDRSEGRGAARLVIFLTDGLPTEGITDEAWIAERVTDANAALEARLHVFGVGYDVNTHLLDKLAAENGGSVTYVQPGEDLERALTDFYGKIARPVLTDLEIEFEGLEVEDLYPEALPDLFHGSSLLLAGRYQATGDEMTVRVRGWAGEERREYVYRFDLEAVDAHDFVPRLWATRRVGALLDRVRVEGETPALVEEIQGLGLAYGLVTPYTTFVIAGQVDGAASAANMELYRQADLNQAWGQTAVQARVQNQAYQQAAQANLAAGANVVNVGRQSLAQVGSQNVDLSLLQGQKGLDGPVTEEWVAEHVPIDRIVEFGSEEYLALAEDPEVRPFLQSGPDVVFAYGGEVIAVPGAGAADGAPAEPAGQEAPEAASGFLVVVLRWLAGVAERFLSLVQ